jgi:hypothetical protein
MKKSKPVSIDINLAVRDPFFESLIGKSLKWALSVGRYIVIFTELVVILSFVTRFTLDRQVTDLNASIEQKRGVILSYGDLEDNFRIAQDKIDNYNQVEQQTNIVEIFPSLSQIIPKEVQLDELIINQDRVVISGVALSQSSLNTLINNVQISPDYFNVVVDRIESEGEKTPGFAFSIRASTKEEPKVKKTKTTTTTEKE